MVDARGRIGHGPVVVGGESFGERCRCLVFRDAPDQAGDSIPHGIGEVACG